MADLKPCPFCGGTKLKVDGVIKTTHFSRNRGLDEARYSVRCNKCHARGSTQSGYTRNAFYTLSEEGKKLLETGEQIRARAIEAWNRRTTIEVNFYDKEETYPNCTVQVLTNTVTGDVSVGWWKNGG